MQQHPYDSLVTHLKAALTGLRHLGLGESLAKGRVGEVVLAHHLGHTLKVRDKGADGIDSDGRKYEYKVSHDDQFNFNFGHARGVESVESLAKRHFDGFTGAYCALMSGPDIVKVVYCPADTLIPYLCDHLRTVTGSTFQKVFSPIERFAELSGARWEFRR